MKENKTEQKNRKGKCGKCKKTIILTDANLLTVQISGDVRDFIRVEGHLCEDCINKIMVKSLKIMDMSLEDWENMEKKIKTDLSKDVKELFEQDEK